MAWTEREVEIICLVRQGFSYKRIGIKLGIETGTVATYVHRIGRLLEGDESPLRKILLMESPPSPGREKSPTNISQEKPRQL